MANSLISKYNVPGPRYTSYPTVPYWDEVQFEYKKWELALKSSFNASNSIEGISLYIHLPFCENLCTFCGCNKRITKNHNVESPYIDAVLKEWGLYLQKFDSKPIIKEIHLGGGTPTFFSPQELQRLMNGIFKGSEMAKDREFGFEGHPNNTTKEHLKTLFDLGFNRCSFGVQDYDPIVQKTINRVQPFENVENVTNWAREIGYESISHDLVFGLPHQKISSVENTISKTAILKPDRLAYYSYAHVPWIKGVGQRGYSESDLPSPEEKRKLYELGREQLEAIGYFEIGMDHFALKHDNLYKSFVAGKMHRNFMGFTASKTQVMVGLGVSSIGDSYLAFGQNEKVVEDYYKRLEQGELPIFRGHVLNEEDLMIRDKILDLMCRLNTDLSDLPEGIKHGIVSRLDEMQEDGILIKQGEELQVPDVGLPFIRNICMAFDLRMIRRKPETQLFSMTI
jgi:oxygen-independent coproporphyrinogen-3 oxidase